jgi:hypothetical protein
MPQDINIIELRQAGLGDHFECLAGRIGEQVEMKGAHRKR